MNTSDLIYDWNKNHPPGLKPLGPILLNDETLRDGLQSPSVRDPSIAEKIEIIHLMEALGIQSLALGLPGAGQRAVDAVTALAREIASHKMKIRANCAARTHENDIRPIAEIVKPSGENIRVDWHGHSDRGLSIANSMAAIVAGANCVHGCAIGLGERVGNTQIDQMLVNLKLMGIAPWDQQNLTKLKHYCQAVSRATGVPIPKNYPVVGDDAFRTATGVHASAIIKAYHKDDVVLANTVYSGVPSHEFGLEQIIDVGPMSGKSNVLFWLERHGIAATDGVVERIYQRAKQSDHTLSEAEILECVPAAASKR